MHGVPVRGRQPIAGAQEFISRLRKTETPFLVISNHSLHTPRDLSHQLSTVVLTIPEKNLFTSALSGVTREEELSAFPTGPRACSLRALSFP
jgi:NagD protein